MAFLDKNGLQTLTNKLTQGDAIKVASHRGHTVTNVIDNIKRECDNVSTPNTMKIENNIHSFKIGQGVDLDVSGDVEEGKVEVELKGKTYQNLCESHISFSANNINLFSIEDFDEHIRVTKTHSESVSWSYAYNGRLKSGMLKPNVDYTVLIKLKSSKHIDRVLVQFVNGNSTNNLGHCYLSKIKDDIFIGKIRTSAFDDKIVGSQVLYIYSIPSDLGEWREYYKKCIVLEGDYTNTPAEELPQYFEGIKSSFEDGVVDVEVQGKNLFDASKINQSYANGLSVNVLKDEVFASGNIKDTYTSISSSNSLPVGRYSLMIYNNGVYCGIKAKIWGYNEDNELIYNISNGNIFEVKGACNNIRLVIQGYTSGELVNDSFTIQIEKASNGRYGTDYEPYYKKKISFNIGEPLRSLPNGICDEIRNNNGQWELIRRVGYYKPKADDYARVHIPTNRPERIAIQLRQVEENCNYRYGGEDMLCSHLPSIERGFDADSDNIIQHLSNKATYINLSASKWGYNESNGKTILTNFLSQNPSFIYYYELKVPTVTPIEPIEFDIKPLASININSHIVPTSAHSVELNRASQIERGIVEIAKLKERVDALEVAYDSHFIETQHKLSLLGLEYEIEGGNY